VFGRALKLCDQARKSSSARLSQRRMSFIVLTNEVGRPRLCANAGPAAPSIIIDAYFATREPHFNSVYSLKMSAHVWPSTAQNQKLSFFARWSLGYRLKSLTQHQLLSSPTAPCQGSSQVIDHSSPKLKKLELKGCNMLPPALVLAVVV